jgi:hypothetical protein
MTSRSWCGTSWVCVRSFQAGADDGDTGSGAGFELVHLCATFSADPFVMSFAQVSLYVCAAICLCLCLSVCPPVCPSVRSIHLHCIYCQPLRSEFVRGSIRVFPSVHLLVPAARISSSEAGHVDLTDRQEPAIWI